MGFGAMGMASWVFGAIAVATIWGGLGWLLAALGRRKETGAQPTEAQPKVPPPRRPLPEPEASTWQQPAFSAQRAARHPDQRQCGGDSAGSPEDGDSCTTRSS